MNEDGKSVEIRPMAAGDLDRVMELAATLPEAPRWPEAAYRKALDSESNPPRIALVADEGPPAGVVGFVIAGMQPPDSELETIAVASDRRRHGVGRELFQSLAAALRLRSVSEIWLEVRASNRAAVAFYRSLGFIQTGSRRGYYTDPIEDAVQMALRLT